MGFSENLCRARKMKGISQEEMANKLNVTRQCVSLWENNQTVPSLDNLAAISQLLEVNVSVLLGQDPFPDDKEKVEYELKKQEKEKLQQERRVHDAIVYSWIGFGIAMASTILFCVPVFGLLLTIFGGVLCFLSRRVVKNNINLLGFIFNIVYFFASICAMVGFEYIKVFF